MSDEAAVQAPIDSDTAPAPTNEAPTENGTANGSEEKTAPPDGSDPIDSEDADPPVQQNGSTHATSGAVDDAVAENSSNGVNTEKKAKRKSIASTPSKKLSKKKSMPTLHLDCKPGEHYWARMKGHPPWPAIIADESMLPEQLLATRPVSTARPDGSLRADYMEGGKNAKERTYAVMYLATGEFSWINNTNLTPLDPEECKEAPKSKVKKIAEAYELATEQHDLSYYKGILEQAKEDERKIEEEKRQLEEEALRKAEERQTKAEEKKKKPRKSKAADDEDVEMEDAGAPKSAKKRKKGDESDGEGIKPKKTPKVTKLNGPKTPAEAETPTAKKAASKTKKKVTAPKVEEEVPEVKISEEEREAQLTKHILYFRHRLQKGFLARDESPKESEMAAMAEHFAQVENYKDLPPNIIRSTKIHKVLKAIVKLSSIPKEEEYHFKKRSSALLEIWNKRMEADGDSGATKTAAPAEKTGGSNGSVAHTEQKPENGVTETKSEEPADGPPTKSDDEGDTGREATSEKTEAVAGEKKESEVPAVNGESSVVDEP